MINLYTLIAGGLGLFVGYFLAQNNKPKEHPLLAAIRSRLKEREKKNKEINVDEEIKKLMGGE